MSRQLDSRVPAGKVIFLPDHQTTGKDHFPPATTGKDHLLPATTGKAHLPPAKTVNNYLLLAKNRQ